MTFNMMFIVIFFYVLTLGGLLVQCLTVLFTLNAFSHVVAVHAFFAIFS